jgi:hypothetical protein
MANIAKAIKAINPDACFHYNEEDFSTLVWDNETTPISQTDIEAKISELQTAEDAEKQVKENAKVSGNQKLLDLGLTQAEATALTGYTPPTEV